MNDTNDNSINVCEEIEGDLGDGKEMKVADANIITKKRTKYTVFGWHVTQIKWSNVVFLLSFHLLAIYGYIHAVLNPVKLYTVIFVYLFGASSGIGILVGSHRLWAHRSFKARFPLKVLLLIFQTISLNGSVFSYARDHRTHHKWSDTDADPKNSNRGFFFAHVGWWLLKKNPDVLKQGSKISYDDLWKDPLIRLQHKFYLPLAIILSGVIPTLIPCYCWNESLLTAFLICVPLRAVVILHHMWTVNSIAHIYGDRPYDTQLRPTENKLVIYLSMGEGSHNYHHAFPWDYATSDQSWWESFNPASAFILISSLFCMAYDLKKPSQEVIQQFVTRAGDVDAIIRVKKRHICARIVLGIIDWALGLICIQWTLITIVIFKLILGKNLIYI